MEGDPKLPSPLACLFLQDASDHDRAHRCASLPRMWSPLLCAVQHPRCNPVQTSLPTVALPLRQLCRLLYHPHAPQPSRHSRCSWPATRSTLQGLLRRLGAGFEDIYPPGAVGGSQRVRVSWQDGRASAHAPAHPFPGLPAHDSCAGSSFASPPPIQALLCASRCPAPRTQLPACCARPLQSILVMLKDEDEMQQLAGLTELCEYLSISTEDTLAAFPTEQVVPLLVGAGRAPAWHGGTPQRWTPCSRLVPVGAEACKLGQPSRGRCRRAAGRQPGARPSLHPPSCGPCPRAR